VFYGDNRQDIRSVYYLAWRKHQRNELLSALEQMIVDVVLMHPEYQTILGNPDAGIDKDFPPELGMSNPFLHMGLHISIQEQLTTDRPPGIRAAYRNLIRRRQDAHATEHQIMECLAQSLWTAQRDNTAPDEQAYLRCVQALSQS
jgi:hypothetical protein